MHYIDVIHLTFPGSNNGSSQQKRDNLYIYYWYAAGESFGRVHQRNIRNKF
jgi:hypothetical protein